MNPSRALTVLAALGALLALVWFGLWYAEDRGIAPEFVAVLLPALVVEVGLYFFTCSKRVLERAEELPPGTLALLLTLVAPLSWLTYTVPLGRFSLLGFVSLVGLGGAAAFWYLVFGRKPMADGGFLILLAVPMLLDVFKFIYPSPVERVPMHVAGAMMWYRTGLVAILALRRMDGIGFGFLPTKRDWVIGMRNFAWFLPPGLVLAFALEFVRVRDVAFAPRTFLLAVATFAGVLWVLAVAEEFFFRGLVQQHLTRILGNETAGLVVASVLFGAVHLAYRDFPNWRFALLAGVAGLFYGRAYIQARSIRAAMVTHACVVTTWKVFLG